MPLFVTKVAQKLMIKNKLFFVSQSFFGLKQKHTICTTKVRFQSTFVQL